jgi:hypothetical protein
MSSESYKAMRAEPMELQGLYNPLTGKHDLNWKGPTAAYRTPTLVSIWATAPYLHNNSVGNVAAGPLLEARMDAYQDGMRRLLWPDKRRGVASVKVTSEETSLPELFPKTAGKLKFLEDMKLKILSFPKGTPINLIMNLNPDDIPELFEAYISGVVKGEPRTKFESLINRRRDAGLKAMTEQMLKQDNCPDFVEDRGHTYGAQLSDADKDALIAYMQYF